MGTKNEKCESCNPDRDKISELKGKVKWLQEEVARRDIALNNLKSAMFEMLDRDLNMLKPGGPHVESMQFDDEP